MSMTDTAPGPDARAWQQRMEALGAHLRARRELAGLSLRSLAALTGVSNAYLSELERGHHEPSLRVLGKVAEALDVPAEDLFDLAGLRSDAHRLPSTEDAIMADPALTSVQKQALLAVYRSFANLSRPPR
jgi:transcriptional regulator with XRE-family HTH domain